MCVRGKETDRQKALFVSVCGTATGSWLLLFNCEFVCLYIGCSIIKNGCSDASKQSRAASFDDLGSSFHAVAESGRENDGEFDGFGLDWHYDTCGRGRVKHLHALLGLSRVALELWPFRWHVARNTLYFPSLKLCNHRRHPAPWYFGDFRTTFKQH